MPVQLATPHSLVRRAYKDINLTDNLRPLLAKYGMQVNDLSVALTVWATAAFSIVLEETTDHQDKVVWFDLSGRDLSGHPLQLPRLL